MPLSPRTLRPYKKKSSVVTDPYFSNVSLLLHMNGSNGSTRFTDSSPSPQVMSVTNATISTTRSKFGGASGSFNGTNAYIEAPSTGTSCTFGTGDFTVECWFYTTSLAAQNSIFDTRPTSTSGSQIFLAVKTTGAIFLFANNADRIVSSAGAVVVNTWNHVALSRVSGQTRLFLNGTQVGSTYADTTNYTAPSNRQCRIGAGAYFSAGSEFLVGNIDEFRVTKGVGRYVSSFTPQTTAFPDNTPTAANADAADWIDRVYANGGTVTAATASAVDTFAAAIETAGIRDRFYRLNLFAGTGLNACLVPLYRGVSLAGTQYGNAADTNNGPFVSSDYAETGASGGLTGNGTSKYLITGLTTSALPQIATGHLSVYAATYPTAGIYGLLTSWGNGYSDPLYLLESNRNGAGNLLQSWGNNYPAVNIASGAGTGLLMTSRTGGTSLKAYRNGSQIGSTSTTSITPAANNGGGFGVFANTPQSGFSANYFPGRLGGYSIGAGMSDAEAASYYTAMQALQTALGRNV